MAWLVAILLVGVVARAVMIDQPFDDAWAWRETDVAMIARNMLADGLDLLHPRIDWAGAAPGYVGTEFPLVPLLAAVLYPIFGEHEWVGRAVAVAFFAVSLPAFFLLVRRVFGRRAGLLAASFYALAPLSVFAGRSFMSDAPSLSLTIIGLHLFTRWLDDDGTRRHYAWAVCMFALAILTKVPAAIIGIVLVYLLVEQRGWTALRSPSAWMFALAVLLPSALWYLHAAELARLNSPYQFFGSEGLRSVDAEFYWRVFRRTFLGPSGLTPILALPMAIGLFMPAAGRCRWLFHWWLAAVLIFVAAAGWGNRHPWYQLPLVPIAAALAGRAVDVAMERAAALHRGDLIAALLPGILITGLAATAFRPPLIENAYLPAFAPAHDAGIAIRRMTPPGAMILVVGDGEPVTFYYARRKGWHFYSWVFWSRDAVTRLEQCRASGADFLVINRYYHAPAHQRDVYAYLNERYRLAASSDDYLIYDLRDGSRRADQGPAADDLCLERP